MEPIRTRYGASLTLPLDAGDLSAVRADIFIGRPGEQYTLTKDIALVDGKGVFEFDTTDTQIPKGKYYYQVNVTDEFGNVDKYPSPDGDCGSCEDEFPEFIVYEALDATEVS